MVSLKEKSPNLRNRKNEVFSIQKENVKLDLRKYGFTPDLLPENAQGSPARVTAVHKDRYALVCEYGETYGRLKTKE